MRMQAELGCFLVVVLIGSAQGQTAKEVVVHSFGDASVADPHQRSIGIPRDVRAFRDVHCDCVAAIKLTELCSKFRVVQLMLPSFRVGCLVRMMPKSVLESRISGHAKRYVAQK